MISIDGVADGAVAGHPALRRLASSAARHDVSWLGRRVCWRRFGAGGDEPGGAAEPLVLLHGGHGNWMHWVLNIEHLAKRRPVWVPDMPGFGDSENLDGAPHTADRLERLVDALIGTLDTLVGPGATIDLVGFSFGGLVAGHVAARHSGVRRLALLGPAGHGGTRRQRESLVDWRLNDRQKRLAALRHNLCAFMLHRPAEDGALALAVHEAACVATRFRSKAISRGVRLSDALDRFTKPVLMIWGEHDVTAVPEEAAERLAGGHAGRDWCVVPGAGHWVQYERYHDINQLLTAWFESRRGDSRLELTR